MQHTEVSAFHRKYRSKTFNEYMGNDKMKNQLMRAFKSENLPQIILLTGTSGGGKTTMSRLIAKEYMCYDRDEEKGACGECTNCQIMNQFIETGDWQSLTNDVQEVDATAQGSKADIDALMEEMERPSFDGTWRVFILDECHEIPKGAQNRLLKTLEEPPEKVLILLATTDPQKLLSTILTRCQYNFEVSKPTLNEAIPLLSHICEEEQVAYDVKAFNLICVKADYVPRQILVNLDKVIQQTGKATYTSTVEVLEMVSDDLYTEFFELLLDKNINIYKYISLIGRIKDTVGVRAFVNDLIPFIKRGLYITVGATVQGLDKSEIKMYNKIFGKLSMAQTSNLLKKLIELRNSIDPETLLLYLGYNGLEDIESKPQEKAEPVQSDLVSVMEEAAISRNNYDNHTKLSEEDKLARIESATKPVSFDDLISRMGAKVVRQDS